MIGGLVVAGGVGLYLWRRESLSSQAASLNAKCVANRTLAQEALSATPARQAAIRTQIETAQGQKFLSDFEWSQWMKAQANASCSATA